MERISVQRPMTLQEKLEILADAAKYDVSCTSSGSERKNSGLGMGNGHRSGICHAFAGDGRCISLLKILMSNDCCYDCRYCMNRISNDVPRATFSPEEICTLTVEFYRRNYIEGLFLSSGVLHTPDYTMERMYEVLALLRRKYHFCGYIHVKLIPGADAQLVDDIGFLADRVSCNLELPTAEGLKKLAPAKTRTRILTPMRQIQKGIEKQHPAVRAYRESEFVPWGETLTPTPWDRYDKTPQVRRSGQQERLFVPAGQSTQMIIGATPESDYQIISVTESLYQRFHMKRVFYSAYVPLNEDPHLPAPGTRPPILREHRLYQADWLLRFYGFKAEELLDEQRPNFNVFFDPKCDWALRHLDMFPVEVNKAGYRTLLRVPGVGVTGARRICRARKFAKLTFDDLQKLGIVLKRALYFITCQGRMMYPTKIDEDYIARNLLSLNEKLPSHLKAAGESYRQLSLFDDFHLTDMEETAHTVPEVTVI